MDLNAIQLLFLFGAVVINGILALAVHENNKRSATNFIYVLLSLNISIWLIANYISIHPSFLSESELWVKLSFVFASCMSVMFFYLAYTIPDEKFKYNKTTIGIFILNILAIVSLLSPLGIKSVDIINGAPSPNMGPGLMPFSVLSTLLSISAIYILYRKIKRSSKEVKAQLRYVMYGILAMLGLIILTIFIPVVVLQTNLSVKFLPAYTLVFLGMTAYAIVKHHLFNLKVFAAQALTFVIWVALLAKVFTATDGTTRLIDILIFLTTVAFGSLLIRSVKNEIQQKEQLKTLSENLSHANEQLTALDKARAEFISIASHQLRTPPATIKWYLAAVLGGDYGKLNPKVKNALSKAQLVNNGQISLIDDMLNVSRIERGKMEFLFERMDIESLASNIIIGLTPQATIKKLKLVYKKPKFKLPEILADKEKLSQVFNNLVDNAIKYTKTGSVIVAWKLTKDDIIFTVTDTGKGLTGDESKTIFEKYGRGKDSQHHASGLGLGLYVAKVIVEHHHGKLTATSPGPEKGTTFIVTLPIKTDLKEEQIFDMTKIPKA